MFASHIVLLVFVCSRIIPLYLFIFLIFFVFSIFHLSNFLTQTAADCLPPLASPVPGQYFLPTPSSLHQFSNVCDDVHSAPSLGIIFNGVTKLEGTGNLSCILIFMYAKCILRMYVFKYEDIPSPAPHFNSHKFAIVSFALAGLDMLMLLC